jgi:imidazolonepropionase-like amidohydrolase
MDQVFRPETAEEARKDVRELAPYHPDLLKMWVDDGRGRVPKMSSEIYSAIIDEAHKNGLRVAAHLWYLEDARKLVDAGLDVIAHSIRDQEIDDDLLAKMKRKGVVYIPTLSLDEFAYMYGDDPDWINDPFFKAALEPGVYEMITNPDYKNKVSKDPGALVEKQALQTALKNLKKVYDAGIMVALGTDAGAQPVRAMGFSEHMELELMVKAGLTPLQALTVATMNGAVLFRADREIGTIAVGKKANFIVLDKDPTENIRNSRAIHAVWKNGKKVSDGPLAGH